ncbi:MAG: hypothetical protein LQ337_001343 [Flavoplaca oasis]|nr:MAG: hypothetical protein LQ337_001343 [Flavoplaca oasis]
MQAIISQSEYQSRDRNFDKPHGSTSTGTHLPSNSSSVKPATRLNPNAKPFSPSMFQGAAKPPFVYNNLCLGHLQTPISEKLNLEGRSCGTWAAAFATLVNQHDVLAVLSLCQLYASTFVKNSTSSLSLALTTSLSTTDRGQNGVQTNGLNHNTSQLRQRIPAASHLTMQGHDAGEQTVGDINALLTGNNRSAKLPNPCCSNSDHAFQSQATPTAQELGATCLIKGEFAPQTIYPTPDPRASMNIFEVIQPRIGSHDLTGDCITVASVPDNYPPEYTEEDQSGQVHTLPSGQNPGSQDVYRLTFLTRFICKIFEHPWNSREGGSQARTQPRHVREFDMQAFLAADVVEQEDQEEDCDEHQDALASEQNALPENHQRIRNLSEFVYSLYETAMDGGGPLRLDKLHEIQKSVGEELWEEMID